MAEDDTMSEAPDGPCVVEGTSSGIEYLLHPLVLINISDHTMRAKASGSGFPRVIGCLLGQLHGRTVDVINSFELLETAAADSSPTFDAEMYSLKLEQYQEVFKSLDVIGWYATGGGVQATDLAMHRRVAEQIEAPIFLSMDPQATMAVGAKELPLALYESGVHLIDGKPETRFVQVAYSMASSDAERIGVNSAAEVTSGAVGENSALARHYSGLHGSLVMLAERVEALHGLLEQMQSGTTPVNHQVLRMVAGLLSRFPGNSSKELTNEVLDECTDTTLVNMLCVMTRGVSECHQLVEASSVAYARK